MQADAGVELVIFARGLAKHCGDISAAEGIDLDVRRGSFFTVRGPNGAGKTTLLRMLATLTAPSGGTAEVAASP